MDMIHLSNTLSPRLLLVLLAVFFVLLVITVLFLGYVHQGGIPTLADSTVAVVN
jgi:hypothetical protein